MIIKSFTAESAAAALKQVRLDMGGDAVVLKTRHVTTDSGARRIEVTACLDKPVASKPTPTAPADRRISAPRWKSVPSDKPAAPVAAAPTTELQVSSDALSGLVERFERLEAKLDQLAIRPESKAEPTPESNPVLELVERQLIAADVPDVFRSIFLSTVAREHSAGDTVRDEAQKLLVESLADLMQPSLTFGPGDVVVLMGGAGVGKTSLLGKLAARLVMTEKKKVRLLSLDASKVGAHDEIESYAALLGIDVADGHDDAGASDPDCVTLIDTSALPTTIEAFADFARRLEALKPTHRVAVFSAPTRTTDVTRQARQMRVLSPTHFAFSMLDLTACHGAAIAAAEALSVKLAIVSNGAGGMGTVCAPDPTRMAEQMLSIETEADHE